MATILVVDDDADTRELMTRYLGRAGHATVDAANGWEALIALDRHAIDLILLDVMMPGMDGRTFLEILRDGQFHHDVPVIAVSALTPEAVRARLGKLGLVEVLPKEDGFFAGLLAAVSRHAGGSAPPFQ
jgi:two-component system, OmpR family, response regulator